MGINWNLNDTLTLIDAVELIKPPASYLSDTFFPKKPPVAPSTYVAVEYRKRGRQILAPYIVSSDVKGVNIGRTGSRTKVYAPPMIGPRRNLGIADIEKRMFGETPVFSKMQPEERAARIIADDLNDMLAMMQNRKNKIAADILTTGKTEIVGYADDGKLTRVDTVDFTEDWDGNITLTSADTWDKSDAKIFDQLQAMSEKIQEDLGEIPTLMLVGKNVPKYLRQNKEIMDWLMIPNRENFSIAQFHQHYTSPQVMYVGRIEALNLEIVSYAQTYTDDDGKVKPFLDPDSVIIATPGKGSEVHGRITMVNDTESNWETYDADYVPRYMMDKNANQMSLTLYSRFMLVPDLLDSWCHCRVANLNS